MAALTDGPRTAEFLLSEENGWRSRDTGTVTVAANTVLKVGQVMEVATGKYIQMATSANAAGILYGELRNDTAAPVDMKGVIINRDAEIRTSSLLGVGGTEAPPGAGAIAALRALGLILRP